MRKVILIIAGLFVVAIIGLVVVISQVDISEYKEQALAQVEKATGRKISIEGELDLAISMNPSIVAEDVRFANADWGTRADMAIIKRIEVQVALLPLLSGEVEIQRFILIEPDVLLEKNLKGKGNWEISEASATQDQNADSEMTAINIGSVLVKQLKLVYKDASSSEKPTELSIETLKLDSVAEDQLELTLKAALDKNAISVNGKIGSLERLFDNDEYPVDVTAKFGAATATLKGVIKEPMQARGLELATTFNVAKLSELNSLTDGDLPAIGPLSINASLTDTDGKYNLADLKLSLADTTVTGKLSADLRGKLPYIKADLQSASINLVPFQPEAPADEKVERYFTADALALDGLRSFNADVTLAVKKIQTRQAILNNFKSSVKLKDSKLAIKPLSMNVGGGKMSGSLNVDASQKQAGVSINLDGKNIQLGQLEALKEKLSGGASDITLRINGKGNTTQAIVGSSNGKLLVKVGAAEMKQDEKKDGVLAGLGGLLNPFSKKDNSKLDCAVLNFKISNGIATANKGIGVETKQITISGGGEINLKNEKLALGFEPNATGAVAGTLTNLASGMKAGGTLANPKISINPAGVAMGALKSVVGGGDSIISGLFGKKKSGGGKDTTPCQTALTGKRTPSTTPAETQQVETEQPSKIESVTKDVLDAPKNLFKGLFGK